MPPILWSDQASARVRDPRRLRRRRRRRCAIGYNPCGQV